MSRQIHFSFPLPNGLHARPASALEELVRTLVSEVTIINERSGRRANARSIFGLVGTEARLGDACVLIVEGSDEIRAESLLAAFLKDQFLAADAPLPSANAEGAKAGTLPRSLKATGLERFYSGAVASPGLGWGRSVVVKGLFQTAFLETEKALSPGDENSRFEGALRGLLSEFAESAAAARGTEAAIRKAHLSLLRDPAVVEHVHGCIEKGHTAGQAIVDALSTFSRIFQEAESAYVRERVLDLQDVGARLLERLYQNRFVIETPRLEQASILVAENLTPGQFLALDRAHLQGLILGHAGLTSHTVILARSFNVPVISGVPNASVALPTGTEIILDAQLGLAVPEPTEKVRRYYQFRQAELRRLADKQGQRKDTPTTTADGRRVRVAANIGTPEEAPAAFAQGAEGIGLFRTEMLFLEREAPPDEEEQYEAYASVARAAVERSVILRSLDIGGDKHASYLNFPTEDNPYLGYRAVRFYEEKSELVKTQFRAVLRAAAHGPLQLMIPLISCMEEVFLCKRLLDEARAELRAAGKSFAEKLPLGIMLEVPSVAFFLDELCPEVDFLSIGTNDLTQYFLAADRENAKVAGLYSSLHPSFLRLLKRLVEGARTRGKWIGLCGELGENAVVLPLLVGLGLDEISLAAPQIAATKTAVAKLNADDCVELLTATLACGTRALVEEKLSAFRLKGEAGSLLAPGLVILDSDSQTKEEAIREMAGALYVTGRAERPESVEEAIWLREDSFSTGLGDGVAIPHCMTDEVTANSIVLLRLRTPIEWNAVDGHPVDLALLLAIRARDHGKEHMKTLARLSRVLTRKEFRDLLRKETDVHKLAASLQQAIDPSQELSE